MSNPNRPPDLIEIDTEPEHPQFTIWRGLAILAGAVFAFVALSTVLGTLPALILALPAGLVVTELWYLLFEAI